MNRNTFPKEIRSGNARVRIYHYPRGACQLYRVTDFRGRRRLVTFADYDRALDYAREILHSVGLSSSPAQESPQEPFVPAAV